MLGSMINRDAIEDVMRECLASDITSVAPLYGMMRYHLGWATEDFAEECGPGGKRLRPILCLLCCEAAGGDPRVAMPAAAAIELLHNFTLVHDDIQDQSAYRRHRRTVWHRWGLAHGITVGDGLHSIANRALMRLRDFGVPANRVLDLIEDFEATALRICEGQYLDLDFEGRWDVTGNDYIEMIDGKTAAIFSFAASVGATLANVGPARRRSYQAFGRALGLGFQVQDDILGIWGSASVTGKGVGDDLRRRKKSLPVLLLHDRASEKERDQLEQIFARDEVTSLDILMLLEMLETTGVRAACLEYVERYYIDALQYLADAGADGPAHNSLVRLVDLMAGRED